MSIVLARIDNRLIHGQVLEAWVPHLKADCIVVANNRVAESSLQKVLMEAAVPRNIRVVIGSIAQVAELFASKALESQRVLLLVESSEDAQGVFDNGVRFSKLNLGNMHAATGKERVSCTIALDELDIDHLTALESRGVHIVSQCIPKDKEVGWKKLVRNLRG